MIRRFGFGERVSPLEAELRRITDADLIDVPAKAALTSIIQATHDEGNRREIMRHLNSCLSEKTPDQWRRIHGGLALLEQVVQRGAHALMVETAEGHHFDLVQRLAFLDHFECRSDQRVQSMVRQKAGVLRTELISRMQEALDGEPRSLSSTSASGGDANGSAPNGAVASSKFARKARAYTSRNALVVDGLVSVGHRDDTDSDSAGSVGPPLAEDRRRRDDDGLAETQRGRGRQGTQPPGAPRRAEARRNVMEDSTDSDASPGPPARQRQAAAAPAAPAPPAGALPAAPAPATVADLLDMSDVSLAALAAAAPAPAAPAPASAAAKEADLLDLL